MKTILLLCATLLLLCQPAYANISCQFQDNNTASFDAVDSFSLATTAQKVTAESGFACSGSALSLLSTNTINATIGSQVYPVGSTPQMTSTTSSDVVPYIICKDASCSQIYNIGSTINWTITSLIGLLGLFNASNGSLPLYLRTNIGVNVAAGTYTDQLLINWDYSICVSGIVSCNYAVGNKQVTVTVTLKVTNYCYIDNAPDVAFTPAALPASFSAASGALSIRCTKNAAYTVNLTSANASSSDGWRQMSATVGGTSYLLQYQFYQPGGNAWTQSNDLSVTGSGISQAVSYTAKINPTQTNKPAATYNDTVTVTVTY